MFGDTEHIFNDVEYTFGDTERKSQCASFEFFIMEKAKQMPKTG